MQDPNLIIWDGNANTTFWVDPLLHLDSSIGTGHDILLELVKTYASAEVVIETDCNEDGSPADPYDHHATLENLDTDVLRHFAQAAIIDILARAVQLNVEHLDAQVAGGHTSAFRDGIWSSDDASAQTRSWAVCRSTGTPSHRIWCHCSTN